MSEYVLKREITIARPRAEVFEFFANAENLERITPPELGFDITTPTPIEMRVGTLIEYTLSLRGIPVKWRTEISKWDPPYEFIDRQLSGPYKQWIHRHVFSATPDGGTLIEDDVRYRLPLEPLGDIAHFIVRRELDRIFDFRQKAVAELLGKL